MQSPEDKYGTFIGQIRDIQHTYLCYFMKWEIMINLSLSLSMNYEGWVMSRARSASLEDAAERLQDAALQDGRRPTGERRGGYWRLDIGYGRGGERWARSALPSCIKFSTSAWCLYLGCLALLTTNRKYDCISICRAAISLWHMRSITAHSSCWDNFLYLATSWQYKFNNETFNSKCILFTIN